MVALRGGIGFGVAGRGAADLRTASGKRLTHLQRLGKHSRFDLSMPYLRLNALSSALQEVADVPHPLPAILHVVEARHRTLSGC